MTPDEVLADEDVEGRGARFRQVDDMVAVLLRAAFSGQDIAACSDYKGSSPLRLYPIEDSFEALALCFDMASQQAKGAWWLPDDAVVRPGLLNMPASFRLGRRFPAGVARDQQERMSLARPEVLFLWASLEGLFETILMPIELRSSLAGKTPAEETREAWADVDATYGLLGIVAADALRRLRYGSGWAGLRLPEQLHAKLALVDSLADQLGPLTVRRWRAWRIRGLATRYYAKAKRGNPTQRQVLTRPLGRVLAGHFGGDWLAFLDYLGESPSESEEVTTALPTTHLYVQGSERVLDVATAKGVPVEEVQKMLAAFFGETSVQSPVERRVELMHRYWVAFDEIHSRQVPGMPSLWGLVDDGYGFGSAAGSDQPYHPGSYRRLLPPDLVTEIDDSWGSECLARWPDRIVSATHPHKNLADAFGPALAFWHGCALTAWFICEGPYSRTDLAGLADYYKRQLDALAEVGCPVDHGFLDEMVQAEHRLGPPLPIERGESVHEIAPGISVTTSLSSGNRREGFAVLQEIVTRHRRSWAAASLAPYLRSRWEPELRRVAWEHSRWLAARGKGPTLKQFAKFGVPAANAWFGGDLGDLLGAMGEKARTKPQRVILMPPNRAAFAALVFRALGGGPVAEDDAWKNREHYDLQWAIRRFADEAPRYVQLQEALGRPPDIKEMRAEQWKWPEGIEVAWPRYASVVEEARLAALTIPASEDLAADLPAPPSSSPQIVRPDRPRAVPTRSAATAAPPLLPARRRSLLGRLFKGE